MVTSKFGKFIFWGALTGAAISLFDNGTREELKRKSKKCMSDIRFYSKNRDILKWKMQEKKEKIETVYTQLYEDVSYIKDQVNELKELTPHVKKLVIDTKDAFVESKEEYKTMVSSTSKNEKLESKK